MKASPFTKHCQLRHYWDHCPNCGERLINPSSYSAKELLVAATVALLLGVACTTLLMVVS